METRGPTEICPECGGVMRLAWTVPGIAQHPELRSFKCEKCGDVVTKSADGKGSEETPPERARR
jgi:hypothetical protein